MGTSSATSIASFDSAQAQKPIILLVEDEPIVRQVTREVLEHAGYEVLESDGPRAALRLAVEHRGRIGLLLSDMVMPGMNGLDLARRMQRIQPRLRTVFMSGYAGNQILHTVVRDPLSTYIQKPFTIDVLLTSVTEALEKSSAVGEERDISA